MTKILFLGAAPHQCSAIRRARDMGCTIFTCDNLPANPGHQLADKSFHISVIDHAQVIGLARSLGVDAVSGYASEPCSIAAARVADELGLSGCGFGPTMQLADKATFRKLLRDEGLQDVPFAVFESHQQDEAAEWFRRFGGDVVVKPSDGSGSKGVTLRPDEASFAEAFIKAASCSMSQRVLVEAFIRRQGLQLGGDCFFEDGRILFIHFGESFSVAGNDQPDILSKMFPSTQAPDSLEKLRLLIERSGAAAGLRRGPVNFDALIQPDGSPFLIEMAARNAGNYLPDTIALQRDVDFVGASVHAALDRHWRFPANTSPCNRWHATWVIHSTMPGLLRSIEIAPRLHPHIVAFHQHVPVGSPVLAFTKAGDSLGSLILQFESRQQMESTLTEMAHLCRVNVTAPHEPAHR